MITSWASARRTNLAHDIRMSVDGANLDGIDRYVIFALVGTLRRNGRHEYRSESPFLDIRN